MEQLELDALKIATALAIQLNRRDHSNSNCNVILQQTKDTIIVVRSIDYPIEELDYTALLFIDAKKSTDQPNSVEKWKTLIDRLSKLDGVLMVSIDFTPTPK